MRAKAYSILYLCYVQTYNTNTVYIRICYVLRFTMMMRSDRTRRVSVYMWFRVQTVHLHGNGRFIHTYTYSSFNCTVCMYKNQTGDEPQKQDTQANKRTPS